jgi:hypothetical protein
MGEDYYRGSTGSPDDGIDASRGAACRGADRVRGRTPRLCRRIAEPRPGTRRHHAAAGVPAPVGAQSAASRGEARSTASTFASAATCPFASSSNELVSRGVGLGRQDGDRRKTQAEAKVEAEAEAEAEAKAKAKDSTCRCPVLDA